MDQEETPTKSPVDQLVSAGLCAATDLSDSDKATLNEQLTQDEVDILVKLHNKLGRAESDAARPNFPL